MEGSKRKAVCVDAEAKEKKGRVRDWMEINSVIAHQTANPIRQVVDKIVEPKPKEKIITLHLGDPSRFGNMPVPDFLTQSVIDCMKSHKYDGYGLSMGLEATRTAIAERYSTPDYPLTSKDVCMTCGGSGAIVIALELLANPGDNVLIPKPGFAFYKTAAMHAGINVKYYDLLPERHWEVDLKHVAELIDGKTRAIVINNPSNPCGANYSEEHLLQIVALAEERKIPIITDEIYAEMVFPGQRFVSLPQLSDSVPMLLLGGMAKQFCAPGWRVGWLIVHNRKGRFDKLYSQLLALSQLMLGPTTFIQAAIPKALSLMPKDYFPRMMEQVSKQAQVFIERLSRIDGLHVVEPKGAIYLLVRLDLAKFKEFKDVEDFTQRLLSEEYVYVLPGSCFEAPDYFRLVYCAPKEKLEEACDRIEDFCRRYRRISKEVFA